MKDDRITAEMIEKLAAKAAEEACPVCGAVGQITVTEKWVPTPPSHPTLRFSRGPRGFPLWFQCKACGSGVRVAEMPKGYRG